MRAMQWGAWGFSGLRLKALGCVECALSGLGGLCLLSRFSEAPDCFLRLFGVVPKGVQDSGLTSQGPLRFKLHV